MKILFLTEVLPYPPTSGARIRAYYMLRFLASRHHVTLASFVRAEDRLEDLDHLRQLCAAVHTVPMRRSRLRDGLALVSSAINRQPAVIARDGLPEMRALLYRLVRQTPFDVVHADQTAMAQYALHACRHQAAPKPALLLDQHNAMHLLAERQARLESGLWRFLYRREARLFRRYEAGLCRRFDRLLTVTLADKEAHLALIPKGDRVAIAARISPVPICVETEGWPPLPYQDEGPHLVHLGTMFWPPNVEGVSWFASQVLPLVLRQAPGAIFTIAGKNPPPQLTALAKAGSPVAGHVQVTGFVANPEPLLQRSRAFVVPVRAGGGMRVKILDAWRWGVPIVSTTIGAEGIEIRDGENILLADDATTFAEAVTRLLTDDALATRMRLNGRRWVEERYNWRTVYDKVGAIYQELAPAKPFGRMTRESLWT
jgi:glycosyltransferase involved in cell wall biosynthesis